MTATVLTVIVNYRTAAMTLRAARAAAEAMEGVSGAVTVVDNDSGDGSYEVLVAGCADLPRVRVLQSGHNGGFGAGNNHAIRAGLPDGTRPDFVYLLNSDAFPDRDTIARLRDQILAQPQVGFAGSHVRGEDGETHVTAFRFPSLWSEFESTARAGPITRLLRRHVVAMGPLRVTQAVDWCSGASLMLRMDALDAVGLFDESFFLYFEETDLCHRIQAAGWTGLFCAETSVVHLGSVSTGMKHWARVPGYWFDSRARYFRKRGGRLYLVSATLFKLAGAGLFRLRHMIDRKDARVAPYFFRDLVTHTWKQMARGNVRTAENGMSDHAGDRA